MSISWVLFWSSSPAAVGVEYIEKKWLPRDFHYPFCMLPWPDSHAVSCASMECDPPMGGSILSIQTCPSQLAPLAAT